MSKKIVLIIDNDSRVRSQIIECLGNTCEVIEADDGVKGLRYATKNSPDIIFVDWKAPFVTGETFCNFLPKSLNFKNSKVVFMSAWPDNVAMDFKNTHSFIKKPLLREDIQRAVA